MSVTTRRGVRTAVASLLAAGLAISAAGGAVAEPNPEPVGLTPASTRVVTPGEGPVSISVIVPLVVPPSTTGLLSAEELVTITGENGSLTRQLDAILGTPATLAIDPMILASIRVLGTTAPEEARAWLARLEALSNESFLLSYGDGDLLTAVRTGTADVLTPSGFDFALDPASFGDSAPDVDADPDADPTADATAAPETPTATDAPTPAPTDAPTPTPTETADPDLPPPFPTTEKLLAWETALPSIAWPHGPGVGAADISALRGLGFETVLLSDVDTGAVSHAHAEIGDGSALVIDSARSQALRVASTTLLDTDRAALIEAFTADLAAQATVAPGRAIVLALGRTWPNSPLSLREVLTSIALTDAARLVPLGDVLASPTSPASVSEGSRNLEREAVFAALTPLVDAERTFSNVVVDPAALLDPRRLQLLSLYGIGWIDDPEWAEAVTAFRERSEEIVNSVRIERGSDVVLLARSAGLRVSISNALDLPVVVNVTIDPRSPILRSEGSRGLTVDPNATGSVYLPVQSIANGDARVLTSVSSLNGQPIDSSVLNVSVRAEWETLGTLIFVLVLVLVFAAGVIRIFVKRLGARNAAAEKPVIDAAASDEDSRG